MIPPLEVTGNFDTKTGNSAEDPETITIAVLKNKERESRGGKIDIYYDQWKEIEKAVYLINPHWGE